MSFQNQGFWMTKDSRSLNDGGMTCDNSSRNRPERPPQWFMNGPEADLFPNKKQAVEVPNNNLFSGILNSNVTAWGNASGFPSVPSQFTERLFDVETARTVNFHDRSIPSISVEKGNSGRNVTDDLFGSDPSFALSMSHTMEDPRPTLSYGGIRKVKVNQVKDSDHGISSPTGHTYDCVDNISMSASHSYNKVDENSISMGLAYKGDENVISLTDTYDRENGLFISMGQPNKGDENIISMVHTLPKPDESSAMISNVYNKDNSHSVPRNDTYNSGVNDLSIGQSYNRGHSTIISFGGCNDDDTNISGRTVPSYEFLMGQASSQRSEISNDKDLVEASTNTLGGQATISSIEASKRKEEPKASKKVHNNSFPSNVRSLLSTGILDGVPVKYIAWSREKELRGVIKDSGYQCGCQSCNFSKVVNAYEFERHACCKTKHPNNHIYFENGKTIYGIVQELRNTPQNILFDVIQTITGSPINQKSFRLWKESFLAATRELQRIYGKEEGNQFL